jgi:PAS domain S-box-containing protein
MNSPRSRRPTLQTVSGGIVLTIGIVALLGWLMGNVAFLRQLQESHGLMKFNTSLQFILCGAAILMLGTKWDRAVAWMGGIVAALGFCVLAEYATGWNSGLEGAFFSGPENDAGFNSARMSPLAAGGFLLAGAAILLAGLAGNSRWRALAAGMLACTVAMAGLVALYGYLSGIETAYGWGPYTKLSIPSSACFLCLGIGLIAWTRTTLRQHSADFANWLPVAIALTLTLLLSLVLAASLVDLKAATDARKKSNDVLAGVRTLLGGLSEIQRGVRGYLLTGQRSALDLAESGQHDAQQALGQLTILLADNKDQQTRLAAVKADFAELSSYTADLLRVQSERGLNAAILLEAQGQGLALSNRLAANLNALTLAENKLLNDRTSLAESRFQDTARLELVACASTGLLIVLTVGVAHREISRRRKAESGLRSVAAMQKAILNSADYAIISTDFNGLVTTFNAAAERILGYKAVEVIGKMTPAPWHEEEEIVARAKELSREPGQHIEPGFGVFTQGARKGLPEEREWTIKRKDGSTFPALLSVTPLEDEFGEVSGFLGVLSDLTARRKAETELDRNRKQLEAMLHTSIDGIIVFEAERDTSGKIVDLRYRLLNPAAEALMEQDAHSLIGRSALETLSAVSADDLFEKFVRVIEKDEPVDFEYDSVRGDRTRWFRMAGAKLSDGLLLSFAEISVRKEAEEKLRTFATRLDLATQAMQAGVWDWNVRTNEAYWDRTVRDIFGVSAEEPVTHAKWASAILPEDRSIALTAVPRMVATKQTLSSEYRIRRKDGSIRHLQVAAAPLLDEEGEVIRIIGVNLDVTDRKEREEALRQSELRFSSAFEHATTGMALVSTEGRWLKVNEAICNLLGYSAKELATRTFQDITHPDDLDVDLANVERLLTGETEFYKIEKRYIHKLGHTVWAQLGVSLLRDENGQPLYFISQIEDISQIKRALIQQEDLVHKAQAAERAKSEFLAMMSHEIRTPMNGILGYAELLSSTPMEKDQKEYLGTIVTSGEALLRIIDDILDFSRIESGRISMDYEPFHVAELLKGVRAVLSPNARQKGVGIELEIENSGSPWFVGDAGRLRQVLINLVGNALKFTEAGNVQIVMRSGPASGKDGTHDLYFSVSDTGAGIPTEKLQEIFRPFTQADSSIARRFGGTGLGLTISQRLVDLMGGSLHVESRPGQGSTFSFSITLQATPAPDATAREQGDELNAKFALRYPLEILVADDDRVNLGLISAILKRLGYNPHTVGDGHGVLKAYSQLHPDCILLDMHMPEVDGCEAAERIRQIELSSGARRASYISALTANVLSTERNACLNAGMNDFLSKPFKLDRLAEVLKKAFAAKTGNQIKDTA